MRRIVLIALPLVAAVAVLVTVAARGLSARADGPTYTLAQVEAGLARHPAAWVGRTIRLRALVAWQPLDCAGRSPACANVFSLTEYAADGQATTILQTVLTSRVLYAHPRPDLLLGHLRALPGLGALLPRPQPLLSMGIYMVRLQAAPAGFPCGSRACYWAVIPDAGSLP